MNSMMISFSHITSIRIKGDIHIWKSIWINISFVLFGIEQIGNEIENPFGHDTNDLPLDEICSSMIQNIEDLIIDKPQEAEVLSANVSVQDIA